MPHNLPKIDMAAPITHIMRCVALVSLMWILRPSAPALVTAVATEAQRYNHICISTKLVDHVWERDGRGRKMIGTMDRLRPMNPLRGTERDMNDRNR